MSSTENEQRALDQLVALAHALAPERTAETIDLPLDRVRAAFDDHAPYDPTPAGVAALLSEFVQAAYRCVPACGRVLSAPQALDTAFRLLAEGYDGGCDGVWADLTLYGSAGFAIVLDSVAETLKRRLHADYVHWVAQHYVGAADWATRCAMAEQVLAVYGPYLADPIRAMTVDQLAGCLFEQVAAAVAALGPPGELNAPPSAGNAAASADAPSECAGS